MLPKKFASKARRERAARLAEGSRPIVAGCTQDGRQIRVFGGLLDGETPRDSIGHFLIVASADSKDTSSNGVHTEIVAAGSANVRHPSYDSVYGLSSWSIVTSLGRISMPGDQAEHPAFPTWDGQPIYPSAEAVPGYEPERPAGHGSAV